MRTILGILAIVATLLLAVGIGRAEETLVQWDDGTSVVLTDSKAFGFDERGILDAVVNLSNPAADTAIPQCYRTRAEAEAVCPQFFTYVDQNWSCFYCRLCEIRNGLVLCTPRAAEYLRGSRLAGGQASPGAVSNRRRLAQN